MKRSSPQKADRDEGSRLWANPRFRAIIEDARRSYREQGGITIDEVRKELGLAPAKKARGKSRNRKKA
jgi:hypothetical protein